MDDDELEAFKCNINLSEYAASEGYCLDRKASSRNSIVMRSQSNDKIVIARAQDNHWIYFSIRSDTDNGSIMAICAQSLEKVKISGC